MERSRELLQRTNQLNLSGSGKETLINSDIVAVTTECQF